MYKVEAFVPLGNPEGPDAIEIMGDEDGVQLNILVDGQCAYRLNIDAFLDLKLVNHSDESVLFETSLEE